MPRADPFAARSPVNAPPPTWRRCANISPSVARPQKPRLPARARSTPFRPRNGPRRPSRTEARHRDQKRGPPLRRSLGSSKVKKETCNEIVFLQITISLTSLCSYKGNHPFLTDPCSPAKLFVTGVRRAQKKYVIFVDCMARPASRFQMISLRGRARSLKYWRVTRQSTRGSNEATRGKSN